MNQTIEEHQVLTLRKIPKNKYKLKSSSEQSLVYCVFLEVGKQKSVLVAIFCHFLFHRYEFVSNISENSACGRCIGRMSSRSVEGEVSILLLVVY